MQTDSLCLSKSDLFRNYNHCVQLLANKFFVPLSNTISWGRKFIMSYNYLFTSCIMSVMVNQVVVSNLMAWTIYQYIMKLNIWYI